MESVRYKKALADGLQIKHLQAICKGYLQACNFLYCSGITVESLQMADKIEK